MVSKFSALLVSYAMVAWLPLLAQNAPAVSPSENPAPAEGGGGDLSVLPVRVVLEGRDRSAEIMLRNSGKVPATYRVLLTEMEMDENGDLRAHQKIEGELSAADVIRYSPRQVELAPGETQTVRVQVRKPEDLPPGEYRSHMLFQAVPPAAVPGTLQPGGDHTLSFKISTVMGISIPIIVRHGEIPCHPSITDLRFWKPEKADAPHVLSLHLNQEGKRSLVADFRASVESGGKLGSGTLLWERQGVVIYNIPFRNVHFPLYQAADGSLKGARVKVTCQVTDPKGKSAPLVAYLDIPK